MHFYVILSVFRLYFYSGLVFCMNCVLCELRLLKQHTCMYEITYFNRFFLLGHYKLHKVILCNLSTSAIH